MVRELLPGFDGQEYISFGSQANCTLEVCPIEYSIYRYNPDKAVNIALTAIFGVIMLAHIYLGIRWKTWGYMVGMILGCLMEIGGYACRVVMHKNPFSFYPFLVQIIALTIAPVFFTASIYITLSKSITHYAPDMSRVKPTMFVWIFLPADVLCLILQSAGGAISVKGSGGTSGNRISQAGLSFQLVVLVLFMAAFADFFIRLFRSGRLAKVEWRLIAFVTGITTSVVFILARCCYRVVELKDGYSGETITHEIPFIVMEGVFIIIGVVALFFGHPGLALKDDHVHQYPIKSSGSDTEDGLSYPTLNKGAYPPMSHPTYHAVDRPAYPPVQNERPSYQPPTHNERPTYQPPSHNERPTYQPPTQNERPYHPPARHNERPSYPPVQNTRPAYNHNGQRPVISKPQMQYRPAHI